MSFNLFRSKKEGGERLIEKKRSHTMSNALLNAYLDERVKDIEKMGIERKIQQSPELKGRLDRLRSQKQDLVQLIPNKRPDLNLNESIFTELKEVNVSIIQEKEDSTFKKIWKFLNRPIVKF